MTEVAQGFRDRFGGDCVRLAVELECPENVETAVAALRAAAAAVAAVRHPDEPDDGLASFVSEVSRTVGGAWFWADVGDLPAFPAKAAEFFDAIVESTDVAGLDDAVLKWADQEAPRALAWDAPLSLPPNFPVLPEGRTSTSLNGFRGAWWHAEWRVQGDGDVVPVAKSLLQALAERGWTVGEQTNDGGNGLAVASWEISSQAIKATVSVGSVLDVKQYAPTYEPVGPQAPEKLKEWDARFALGEAWWLSITINNNQSPNWLPFADGT